MPLGHWTAHAAAAPEDIRLVRLVNQFFRRLSPLVQYTLNEHWGAVGVQPALVLVRNGRPGQVIRRDGEDGPVVAIRLNETAFRAMLDEEVCGLICHETAHLLQVAEGKPLDECEAWNYVEAWGFSEQANAATRILQARGTLG
jgi:hypothetical protein